VWPYLVDVALVVGVVVVKDDVRDRARLLFIICMLLSLLSEP